MRRIAGMMLVAVAVLSAVFLAARAAAPDSRVEPALKEARQISAELGQQLQELLGKELAAGGFAGAVRVCSETALETTKEFSARKGRYVRRVTLKNRNLANKPDDYERARLVEFDRLNEQGKLPAEHAEVVAAGGQDVLHYMKPIKTGGVCLTCHGPSESIPAEVQAILAERYPNDLATGYQANQVRGAISVRIALPPR